MCGCVASNETQLRFGNSMLLLPNGVPGASTMHEIEAALEVILMFISSRFASPTLGGTARVLIATLAVAAPLAAQSPSRLAQNYVLVQTTILKGQQLEAQGDLKGALAEYQSALEANPRSSLAHYRIAEIQFEQRNYQASVNACRDALQGDGDPSWTKVWSYIQIGNVFDVTGQRQRALVQYQLAVQTNDNTRGAVDEARKLLQEPFIEPQEH
jgi:tetratricopeptide (TPR) repeat protein